MRENTVGSLFTDMQSLLDTTVTNITTTVNRDLRGLQDGFDSRINEQRVIVSAFEKKITQNICDRIQKLEGFTETLAMQQSSLVS